MFTLPKLLFNPSKLTVCMDESIMDIHYGKHHNAYVTKLNAALKDYPELLNKNILDILLNKDSLPESIKTAVVNNGGGHYNHSFFWEIITDKKTDPSAKLLEQITKDFNSVENLQKEVTAKAMTVFGSGWTWLAYNLKNKKLEIINTANQDIISSTDLKPIFVIDIWEHAYYVKYQNRRLDFLQDFWSIVNWDAISAKFEDCL